MYAASLTELDTAGKTEGSADFQFHYVHRKTSQSDESLLGMRSEVLQSSIVTQSLHAHATYAHVQGCLTMMHAHSHDAAATD